MSVDKARNSSRLQAKTRNNENNKRVFSLLETQMRTRLTTGVEDDEAAAL